MLAAGVVAAVPVPWGLVNKLLPGSEPNGAGVSLVLGCPREKRPGPPPVAVVPVDEFVPVPGAPKRLGVAGFVALSAGLAPPKKFPPSGFVPVDVGAAGLLPPTAGVPVLPVGAVAPPNKPPVGPLALVLPGPLRPKMPPLVVAGFGAGNPKEDAPVFPVFVPAVLPKRFPVAVVEAPGFPKSAPPAGAPEGAVVPAGFRENNPGPPPNALPVLAPGFGAFAFAFPPPPKTLPPIPGKPPVVPGAPVWPADAPVAPNALLVPPNAVLPVVFAPRLPKRPPLAAGVGPEVEGF